MADKAVDVSKAIKAFDTGSGMSHFGSILQWSILVISVILLFSIAILAIKSEIKLGGLAPEKAIINMVVILLSIILLLLIFMVMAGIANHP
ncbi:hypothetical protein [Suttonella ornithocola]|uniref:Uncharacterized protein n=1 Tax=Suttonella ornithocola TaxID=279832 RepID=A0A380MWW6_9GAMM|nr:hypothetical protein [Suttonella ornithocola]SUO96664.1 Uncharacterised protein [Suttonella ornithocola]